MTTDLTIVEATEAGGSLNNGECNSDQLICLTNCLIARRKVLSRYMCLLTLSQSDSEEGPFITACLKRASENIGISKWEDISLQTIPAVGSTIHVVGWLEKTNRGEVAVLCSQFPEIVEATSEARSCVGKGNLTIKERRALCKSEWAHIIGKSETGCRNPKECSYRHDLREGELSLAEELRKSNAECNDFDNKKERFRILADFLVENIGLDKLRSAPVLDVAGGKGYLGVHLGSGDRNIKTIVVDPADKNRTKGRAKLAAAGVMKVNGLIDLSDTSNLPNDVSCVVGLHPDEATDLVVKLALKYKTAFAVVPCCVFPSKFPDRILCDGSAVVTTDQLLTYLTELCAANGVQPSQVQLPFAGKNQILFSNGYQS
eukprot:TRINITY_DN20146_c0_g1_i1.p1 TRINITY_DN20146_c0_g1~~TRINITY_DN20146_c0_g1_i1.p1  ORF type:complete len:373 (+),score=76.59 TRINITY_DN20146_c0_g1_i1:39-1157(+)